jgi:putative transcriptional regulator
MESVRGKLLVAGPKLFDPNFRRTVVLVGEHNEEGALGVVLNRQSPLQVEDAVPPLAGFTGGDARMFFGGPVQPEAAVVLAEFEHPELAGLLVFDSIGFLMGDVEQGVAEGVRRARVFAGYAGWGPGQLEVELEDSSWLVEPALADDLFTDDPDRLWTTVVRRKGKEFAVLSLMPFDPSLN